jgi:hypothetical protein
MNKKPEKPKTRKAPVAQALARHKAAQAPIDAHFGQIDDEALANQLFTAERDALKALAETLCASDAEFVKSCGIYSLTKPAYLAARRTATMISAPLLSLSIVTATSIVTSTRSRCAIGATIGGAHDGETDWPPRNIDRREPKMKGSMPNWPLGGTMSKKRDVQGILTEARSDIECVVMAARQLPPDEGAPIAAMADAVGKKIEKVLRLLGAEVAASHGAEEG